MLSDIPLAPVQLSAIVRGLAKAAEFEDDGPVLVNSGGLEDFDSLDFLFHPHLPTAAHCSDFAIVAKFKVRY